ncbi:hypothetical protein [Sphingobacterium detergens]
MDGYTGKCRGKTTERPRERGQERGRRNVDGGTWMEEPGNAAR